MELLSKVKQSMRITHDLLDEDIKNNIVAAMLDLARVGVNTNGENDGLTEKAIELYVKWQYDYAGKSEEFRENYEKLRNALSLGGKWRVQ